MNETVWRMICMVATSFGIAFACFVLLAVVIIVTVFGMEEKRNDH